MRTPDCSTEFSNVKQNSNSFIKTKNISILFKQGETVHVSVIPAMEDGRLEEQKFNFILD